MNYTNGSSTVIDKKTITEKIINQMDPEHRPGFKQAMSTWWFNRRRAGGLRLTGPGFTVFTQEFNFAKYEFDVTDPHALNQRRLLDLDRKMHMPYYIHAVKGIPKKIIMFGSEQAVWINLYGNLEKFLDQYER